MHVDLDLCLRRVLPVHALGRWSRAAPPEGWDWKPAASGLLDAMSSLVGIYPDREVSGALGIDWVSWSPGGPDAAFADPGSAVSWHSHPPGLPFFSLEDWLVFSLSKASASVLMSGSEVSIYVRRDAAAQPLVNPRDLRECPTLALQGFARKIGMGGNIEAAGKNAGLRDRSAARRLGVERHALAV